MPKNTVASWDTTAANNTDIGGINIDEGWAAADVNNALREAMAQIKTAIGVSFQAYDADTAKTDVANTWTAAQTFDAGGQNAIIKSPNVNAGPAYIRYQDDAGTNIGYVGMGTASNDRIGIARNIAGEIELNPLAGGYVSVGGDQIRVPDGTVSAPAIAPASDTNTGIYALSADSLGFTMGGTHIGHLNSTGWTVSNTSGATTFGSVDAVKNLISGGGQLDITNTTGGAAMRLSRAAGSDGIVAQFHRNTTLVGNVSVTGSATAYNTSSDERLKNFIGQYDPLKAIEIIRADPVRDFNWIPEYGGGYAVGWGAQTSYQVSPDLASPGTGNPGDENFEPWGVDQAKRTPYLWAALTWALDEIETLKARLDAAGL